MALLELKGVSLCLGGPPVLDRVDLRVEKGERLCLLGRNGEGKTTLLRLLAGGLAPDAGELLRPRRLRIGILPQEVPAALAGTVREVVAAALAGLPEAGAGEDWRVEHEVDRVLTDGGLDGDQPFGALSAGSKRRVLLARALVGDPDLLLLDEPTNHLDIDAIAWLEQRLLRFGGTLFFVTHDRAFLRGLAGRILELDRGRLRDWTCDYDTFLARRDELLRTERARWAEFDRKLAQEEVWVRQGVRERRTRNEGRVRELKLMREQRQARRTQAGDASFQLQEAERSGRLVIRAEDLHFAWGDTPVVAGFDTSIMRGDKVGLLGPNGAGKTTLLRLLLGELTPQQGRVRLGTNLQVAYFDQQRAQLDESKTVQENVCDRGDTVTVGGRPVHVITWLQQFLFTPDRARSPISHLSGGERNRLLLARLFTRPANLLVLDEPTNDLDLETLDLLEDLLLEFAGTLLLVSHDREFLDNVCTSTLALEGGGRVVETVGGYADWARVSRAAKEAAAPRAAREPRPRAPVAAQKPRRLSFKEGRELEALPGRIEQLEDERAAIHARLADPDLYREGAAGVPGLQARLQEIDRDLPPLYARWEELEGLRS
ncbi:MAG: ATP-binding cassette domain-containing protein [Krumholzibacteria bacterium]|nr:ATP-binding cassette domain-containing protein [Candidatus Krumholzibacteria bacterium]